MRWLLLAVGIGIILISDMVHSSVGKAGCLLSFCVIIGAMAITHSVNEMTNEMTHVLKKISEKLDDIERGRKQ